MSNSKNAREKDGGHASAINVVLTTLKTTPVSTSSENGIRFQAAPLGLVGGGRGGTEKRQNICCNRSFPSRNSFVLHLVEKAPKDVVHEMTLFEMGMLRCSVCSTWVHRDNMPLHLKKSHGVVKVTKNAKVVSPLSKYPASKTNPSEIPLKTGKSYVIKVSGKTLPTGKSFVVSCPSSKLANSIDVAATSVTSKPPMKLITTTSGSLYPKIHLQRGNNISAGNVVVRQSLPTLPMVTLGSRVIMKSMKISGVKHGVPVATSGIQKLVPVTSTNILQEGGKTVNGVTTLQLDGSTLMASSSSGNFVNFSTTSTSSEETQKLKPNQKSVCKGNKVVSKIERKKLKGTKKAPVTVSRGNIDLVSSKDSQCETSTHMNTELDSSAKESSGEKNKLTGNKKCASSAKFTALQLSFSEDTNENLAGKPEAVAERSNSHHGKVKPKGKRNGTDGKVQVGCKTSMADGNRFKSENLKPVPIKEYHLGNSVSKDEHLLHRKSSLMLSDEKGDPRRETEGVKPTAGKKQRKQILKPVLEPEGDPNMDVPITSKVKVRKKTKKELLSDGPDTAAFAKRNLLNPTTNKKKCGKPLKENKGDTFRPTPKTSHASSRGGRGGWKKRGPGRPRKEEVIKPATPDSYEIDSLFQEADNDVENEPYMVSRVREDENVPTVELDLFTLPSLNEQISVLLTDPHNPDFKVYASMDAIFVGDSALVDVTNQIGYVTDANNVVFVNPGHFLFPNIKELDKFVPSPILTLKEKMGQSPKKLCKLSSSINHAKVICLDKRLTNSDAGNRNKCSKRKAPLETQGSQEKGKNTGDNDKGKNTGDNDKGKNTGDNDKGKVAKSPEKPKVRKHSARLSGDQDDALQLPLKLKKGDLVSKNNKTSRGAGSNKLAPKKLPLKLKIRSASLGKDKCSSVSLDSDVYPMGSGGKELKVLISPLKLEHQSLVEEFLLENRKLPLKSRLALTFSDGTVNKCIEARKKLGAQLVSDDVLKCDTHATSAVCEKEAVCSRRQRTRTRSADGAYSVTSVGIDPVASGNCNDNFLSRRKGRLKSESEVLTNKKKSKSSDSARDQKWSRQNCEAASSLWKTRLRHSSNVSELPETTKTSSNLLSINLDSDDNKHISHKKHNSSAENIEHTPVSKAVAEKTPESDVKESLETLPENSLIKGMNWNITNSSKSLHRTRPVRERRPSSKWLESLAYGIPFRKVPLPMPRTVRSSSDMTDQVSSENLESKLGVDENGVLTISELNQRRVDCKQEGSQESAQGESDTKETASSISNETAVQPGAVENNSDEEKENIAGKNQGMDFEVTSYPSPKKQNDIEKNTDCKIPSNPLDKSPKISCESTIHLPIEQKGACRTEKSDNMEIVSAKQTVTEAIIEGNVVKSRNEILNVDATEAIIEGNVVKSRNEILNVDATDAIIEGNVVKSRNEILNVDATEAITEGNVVKSRNEILNVDDGGENIKLSNEENLSGYDLEIKVSVNTKKKILKRKRTKLILKKVEENFDDILNKTGSVSEDLVEPLSINRTQTISSNLSVAKAPEVSGMDLQIFNVGFKQDGLKSENIMALGTNRVNIACEASEGEAENKLEVVAETRTKAALSENIADSVNSTVLKVNVVEEDDSNKLQMVKEVDDQKITKTILNEMPSETVKSEWSGLLVASAECHASNLPEASVEALEGKLESADIRKLGESDGSPSILDTSSENTELKLVKESLPLKGSISRVSALLIEVSESVKAEEKVESPQKVEGPRTPTKSSSSPTKVCLDISPPREWLGRGAKLKAQVLIQDQQTGVTDSHIVAPCHIYSPEKGKSSSPKSEKLIISTSDTSVNSKASGGSLRTVKSTKSPQICCEEREWQARGAKLKAQVMITDQQTGHTNTRVETFEPAQSPRSSLTSPRPKKIKFESPPGSMKDIRSFFTLCKSPERGITKSEVLSSSPPPPTGQLSSPGSNSSSKADLPTNSSFTNCSPKSISSSPRPSPHSSKRKKVKLYKVTYSDIRNFLTPTSGTKRKLESDAMLDVSKSVKIEKDIFPAIEDGERCQSSQEINKTSKSPVSLPVGVWNIHSLQDKCSMTPDIKDSRPLQENCKTENTSDSCKAVPEVPSVEFDFEGFKLSSRSSDLRAKSLVRIVSHLENKALYGLGHFPLPVDHLCDWNDDWLNIKIFDKHS